MWELLTQYHCGKQSQQFSLKFSFKRVGEQKNNISVSNCQIHVLIEIGSCLLRTPAWKKKLNAHIRIGI